ncbi:ubiquitin-like protein [Pseudomonas pharyngis]
MIIFVRVESSKRITLEVEPSDQIEYVKARIKKVEAVSFDNK